MTVKDLRSKTLELYNALEEETPLKKSLRFLLNETAHKMSKRQLVRNLESYHEYAHDTLKFVLHAAIWDLTH